MEKKLYYKLSDNADLGGVIITLQGCLDWIDTDMEQYSEEDSEDIVYTITPVWMTEHAFENLPEYEG